MRDVNLDVTDTSASLVFPPAACLKPLEVKLPQAVVVAPNARAKFSKKTKQITIHLPVAAKAG